jgi:hypothetical protein
MVKKEAGLHLCYVDTYYQHMQATGAAVVLSPGWETPSSPDF